MKNKVFAIVTSTRADYGLFVPLLKALDLAGGIEYRLIVTGTHLSERHGLTRDRIVEDGFVIAEEVPCLIDNGGESETGDIAARALTGLAQAYKKIRPDGVILLGDRYEIMAAAVAASLCRIPIVHLHGGEVTAGAYDEGFRHAITKLSHVHMTAAEDYQRRIIQMGENPDKIFVVGSLGVENLLSIDPMTREELTENLGLKIVDPVLLVTLHPETLEPGMADKHAQILLDGLNMHPRGTVIFTAANADSEGEIINRRFEDFCRTKDSTVFIPSLGSRRYASVLRIAGAVVGNSSSGIIEVPSFGIPTVNIGDRQKGRLRAPSIIDVGWNAPDIDRAVATALAEAPQKQENPYGSAIASSRIVKILRSIDFGREILKKAFYDLDAS